MFLLVGIYIYYILPPIPFWLLVQQNEPKYMGNMSQIINNVLCSLYSFSVVIIFLIILNPACSLLLSMFVSLIRTFYKMKVKLKVRIINSCYNLHLLILDIVIKLPSNTILLCDCLSKIFLAQPNKFHLNSGSIV